VKYSKQSLNSVIRCCISYQMAYRWKEVEVAVKRFLVDDDDEVRHPHIIHFLGAILEPGNICVVTEFASNGSVWSLLHKKQVKLTTTQIYKIASQVLVE
jgi:hypothetical protein